MITGANTNVKHRGRQFHVQTEDSGRANPHIISHVYHGGTIIASLKIDYSDRISKRDADSTDSDIDAEVRGLIEEQHKAMLKRLVGGEFDEVIDDRLGSVSEPVSDAPASDSPVSEEGDSRGGTTGSTTAGAPTAPSLVEHGPQKKPSKPSTLPAFGESVDSDKPLDEVILEYLVEKARGRGGDTKGRPQRKKRPKG